MMVVGFIGRRIPPLLKVNPVSEHDGAVEREPGLRTVPGGDLANRVVVGPLAACGRQAVQHGRLGMFDVSGVGIESGHELRSLRTLSEVRRGGGCCCHGCSLRRAAPGGRDRRLCLVTDGRWRYFTTLAVVPAAGSCGRSSHCSGNRGVLRLSKPAGHTPAVYNSRRLHHRDGARHSRIKRLGRARHEREVSQTSLRRCGGPIGQRSASQCSWRTRRSFSEGPSLDTARIGAGAFGVGDCRVPDRSAAREAIDRTV
jgi:hypothetical protein